MGHLQSDSRWDLAVCLGLGHKLLVDSYSVLILGPSIGVQVFGVGALGGILATEQLYGCVIHICQGIANGLERLGVALKLEAGRC